MSSDGCLAGLTVYRLQGTEFRDQEGKAVPELPSVLSELHTYWRSRCQGKAFPARADIDPIDIPSLLEHLLLVDVLRDPPDFRYRLVGGHIVEHAGRNVQGLTLRGLMAGGNPQEQALQEKAMLACEEVAGTQAPVFIDLSYRSVTSEGNRRLQGLLLPLGQPGEKPNMVLGGLLFIE